jgi:hypothetical protein
MILDGVRPQMIDADGPRKAAERTRVYQAKAGTIATRAASRSWE